MALCYEKPLKMFIIIIIIIVISHCLQLQEHQVLYSWFQTVYHVNLITEVSHRSRSHLTKIWLTNSFLKYPSQNVVECCTVLFCTDLLFCFFFWAVDSNSASKRTNSNFFYFNTICCSLKDKKCTQEAVSSHLENRNNQHNLSRWQKNNNNNNNYNSVCRLVHSMYQHTDAGCIFGAFI